MMKRSLTRQIVGLSMALSLALPGCASCGDEDIAADMNASEMVDSASEMADSTPDMINEAPDMFGGVSDMPDMNMVDDLGISAPKDMGAQVDSSEMRCGEDEFVKGNVCTSCPVGTTNVAGDVQGGDDTQCDVITCAQDESVTAHACDACAPGSTNITGDDASGMDTFCDPVLCGVDEFVQDNICVSCAPGTANTAGDDASGSDTVCEPVRCGEDEFVQGNACMSCPVFTTNVAGDDASGADTACDETLCGENEFVQNNACVSCPSGTVNATGDRQRGPDTMCDDACTVFFGQTCDQLQTDVLKASNAGDGDQFGLSVSISGDTLVVGSPWEDSALSGPNDNTLGDSGAAHVFVKDPTTQTWTAQALLKASNAGANDRFGWSVSLDGDTLVVGAYGEGSPATGPDNNSRPFSGAAYVFVRDAATQTWTEQTILKASNAGANDGFGYSVSLSADTLVVGAESEDSPPGDVNSNTLVNSGAAYVFVKDPVTQTWAEQAILKASNADSFDAFGWSVSVSGHTAVVGALREDSLAADVPDTNTLTESGAAYVFVRDAVTGMWSEQAILKASNAGVSDGFGFSVSLSADTVVVGANAEDSLASDPAADTLSNSGAVYVFVRDVATQTWAEQVILKASNADSNDQFGISTCVLGDMIVVGATCESSPVNVPDDNTLNCSGATYVFVRDVATQTWTEQAILKASNAGVSDRLGFSVSVSGDTIVSGALREDSPATGPDDNSTNDSGAAYTFEL